MRYDENALTAILKRLPMPSAGTARLVCVEGLGGAGKSTLAAALAGRSDAITLVHGDDFYGPEERLQARRPRVRRADRDGNRLVRVIGEPPTVAARFVALLRSGTARQLAATLIVAADQADELDRDVSAR